MIRVAATAASWWLQEAPEESSVKRRCRVEAPPGTRCPTWASSREATDQHPAFPPGKAALAPRMGADLTQQADSTLATIPLLTQPLVSERGPVYCWVALAPSPDPRYNSAVALCCLCGCI